MIREYTGAGTFLAQWGNSGLGSLVNPTFTAISTTGTVFVLDPDVIKIFNP